MKIKLNQELIVCATKDKIFIYSLDGLRLIDKFEADNHLCRIVLSPNAIYNPFLAFSQSMKEGTLIVYNTST